jgi:hypothetical protein
LKKLEKQGVQAIIQPKKPQSPAHLRQASLQSAPSDIENFLSKFNHFRRVFSRFKKMGQAFLGLHLPRFDHYLFTVRAGTKVTKELNQFIFIMGLDDVSACSETQLALLNRYRKKEKGSSNPFSKKADTQYVDEFFQRTNDAILSKTLPEKEQFPQMHDYLSFLRSKIELVPTHYSSWYPSPKDCYENTTCQATCGGLPGFTQILE